MTIEFARSLGVDLVRRVDDVAFNHQFADVVQVAAIAILLPLLRPSISRAMISLYFPTRLNGPGVLVFDVDGRGKGRTVSR